jgi:hypothetical protein
MRLFPEIPQANSPAINRFCLNPENHQAIHSHYLSVRGEGEVFDAQIFGEKYIRTKYQEHKELEDRLSRRGTKLFQSCCSFTGVFFGVLISWAVSILAMAYDLPNTQKCLSFAGFGTIGTAGIAGTVMVLYQRGQNNNKITEAESKETELIEQSNYQYPEFEEHVPPVFKPREEQVRLGLVR